MSFYFGGKQLAAEDEDGVRGYSLETNDNMGGEDEYFGYEHDEQSGGLDEELVDDGGENDKVPVMPNEFYEQVESFLRKEPPKIGEAIGGKTKKKKKKGGAEEDEIYEKTLSQIPTLPPVNPIRRQVESVPAEAKISKRKSSGESKKQKSIDPQLLRDAFAYTDNLLRNAVLEEAAEQLDDNTNDRSRRQGSQKDRKTHSAPAADNGDRDYLFYGAPAGKGRNAPVNIVRSLKSKKKQQQQQHPSGGRPVHSETFSVKKEEEQDLKRNPLNFEELVANFQSGTTLDRLRKELEDSQNSLKQSKSAIRSLMRK
jgi:hypothetical protein